MGRRYDDDDRYERRRPDPDSLHRRDAEEGRLRRGRYSDSKEGGSPPRRRDRDDDHKRHPDGRDNDIKMKGSPSRTDRDRDRRHRERDSRFNDSEEDDRHMRHGDRDRDRKRRSGSRGNNGKLRENSPRPPNRDKERQQEPSRSSTESGEASPLRKSKDQHGDRRQLLGARETVSKPREDKHSRERGKEIGRQEQSRSSIESGEVSPARKPLDKQGDRRQHLNGRDNISKPREDSSSQQGRGKKRAVPESSRNFTESGGATPKKSMDKHGDHRQHSDGRDIISKPTEDSPRREHSRSSTESGEASPPRKLTDKHNDRRRHSDVRNTIRKRREDSPSCQERDKERGRRGQESSSSYSEEDSPPRRSGGKVDHRRRGRSRSFSDSEEDSSPRRSRGKAARQRRERTVSSSDSEGNSPPRRSRGKEDNRRHRDREERLNRHDREDMVRRDEKPNPNGEAKTTTMEDGITGNPPDSAEQLPPPPPLPDMGRSGGVYIPPFKLARMMREVQDKSGEAYQRMSWDALRKSINGLVNKVNATNIKNIIPELFAENLIRGRGLFCRSCMKSQMASPGFTDVFAALVAVVNTKFPDVGKLLLNRIVLQLKRAYKRNDKPQLLAATKFIAHLVNQQVAHEIIALQLLIVLLEKPTDDSVEVAVGFIKECGSLLQDLSPQGLHGIFERFRGILHEGEIDKRVQFLIEGLFAIRKAKFEGFPAVRPELDLVDVEDQFTHEVSLEDEIDPETTLDIFKPNPQFLEDEKAYENLKRNILGAESSEDEGESDDGEDDEDEDDDESDEESEDMAIKDETETNLINLRRTIYLTIMSSVEFEEAGHKLLKIKLEPGQEMELCIMLLECCSQERTYLRYYGLLGQRFCLINKVHQENFEKCFVQQYSMIHRLETNKLRNVAKFFAHLLGTDALPWHVLAYIRLTEEDTTSSSRIFIKILFQELSEHLGIRLLNERLNEPTMQDSFESIFPKDNPKNTRFAINFFTSIGLGGITESLREYLRNMPRLIMQQQKAASSDDDSGSSGSSSSGSDSGTSSETDSDSDSDSHSSESEKRRKRRKR